MIKYIVFFMVMSKSFAQPLMIAHAGGGIDGISYSNSIEALNKSYANGFRYFEIDFSWTSDKQLVCLHDWGKRFEQVFSYKINAPLSFDQFLQQLEQTDRLHPCTYHSMAHWLKSHSDSKIITDAKHNNLDAIKLIIEKHPEIKSQLIPQFYQPHEYQVLKDMGFKDLIWILYQYQGSKSSIVEQAKNMDLMAICLHKRHAKKKYTQQLIQNGHKVFSYTINKQSKLKKLVKKYQVSGIYTDFLKQP